MNFKRGFFEQATFPQEMWQADSNIFFSLPNVNIMQRTLSILFFSKSLNLFISFFLLSYFLPSFIWICHYTYFLYQFSNIVFFFRLKNISLFVSFFLFLSSFLFSFSFFFFFHSLISISSTHFQFVFTFNLFLTLTFFLLAMELI